MNNIFYRNSANPVRASIVDYYDRTQGQPTPVTSGINVTAEVYAPDRATLLGGPITLSPEEGEPQHIYRGIFSAEIDYADYDEVSLKVIVDGGGPFAYLEKWEDVKMVDE